MTCVAHRRDVLARGLPAADVGGHRLVARRHIERHDARFPGHGRRGASAGARVSDRFGTRIVVLTGARAARRSAWCWRAGRPALLEFQLVYGVLVGLAAGAFFAPMIAAATAWFEHNRSLAVSLVSAGMGVAPMTISPFARWLISTYDWRTAMLTIGIVAWVLLIPAALLVRPPPRRRGRGRPTDRRSREPA